MSVVSEPVRERRRNYARYRAPREMLVGWKSPTQRNVSRVGNFGMGGLFLETATPPRTGSIIELIFDLPTGEIRARATVRDSRPGKGMGIQFVQMNPEVRARLNRFLASQPITSEESGNDEAKAAADAHAGTPVAEAPSSESEDLAHFEVELQKLLEVARKGTYYQLLGVNSQSRNVLIKQNFYTLARKFHPDRHMGKEELAGSLKDLMGLVTQAYKTLSDPQKRAAYDKRLADSGAFILHRGTSKLRDMVEECMTRANECVRARNFVGSIGWLRKCVELAPEEAKHHAMLAHSLSMIEEYREQAIEHFSKAIELDPWNVETHLQLAEFYEELQLPRRAHTLYSKVVEISPGNAKARRRIAELDAARKS